MASGSVNHSTTAPKYRIAGALGKVVRRIVVDPRTPGVDAALQGQTLVVVEFYDIPHNPSALRGGYLGFVFDNNPSPSWNVGEPVQVDVQGGRVVSYPATPSQVAKDARAGWYENTAGNWFRVDGKQVQVATLKDASKDQGRAYLDLEEQLRTALGQGKISQDDAQNAVNAIPNQNPDPAELNADPLHGSWVGTAVPPLEEELFELGELPPGYIRLGYVAFQTDTPMENIQIVKEMPFENVSTLRSRTPIQRNNWNSNTKVILSFTFDGQEAINQYLLPLVRLFKRCPFLPVVNDYLNDNDIGALSLASLQVTTLPGFPNALKLTLIAWRFNWRAYFPSANNLDELFSYPLLKLWVERPTGFRGGSTTGDPRPFPSRWDGQFNLYHLREAELEQVAAQIRKDGSPFQNKAAQREETLNAFKQAYAYSQGKLDIGRRLSFDLSENFPGFQRELNGDTTRWVLQEPAGLANVASDNVPFRPSSAANPFYISDPAVTTQKAVFIRVTDPQILEQVLRRGGSTLSPRDIGVRLLRETVELRGKELATLKNPTVNIRDFLENLRKQRELTENSVRAGLYTVMLNPNNPLIFHYAEAAGKLEPSEKKPELTRQPEEFLNVDRDDPLHSESGQFIVETIQASMENMLAPLQARGYETPTYQYLGSTATYYQVQGTVREDHVPQVIAFLEKVHALARKFPGRISGSPFGGQVTVENEIFQALGTEHVLPVNWQVDNIPGMPGYHRFNLTMVEFDNTQRSREALNDLMKGVETDKLLRMESLHDNLQIRAHRQRDLQLRLMAAELYPDLALPTHGELLQWINDARTDNIWDWEKNEPKDWEKYGYLDPSRGGTGWQWTIDPKGKLGPNRTLQAVPLPPAFMTQPLPSNLQRFADPDFFCQAAHLWGEQLVNAVLENTNIETVLKDEWGTEVKVKPGEFVYENVKDPTKTVDYGTLELGKKFAELGKQGAGVSPYGTGERHGAIQNGFNPINGTSNGSALLQPKGELPAQGSVPAFGTDARSEGQTPSAARKARYLPVAVQVATSLGVDPALFAGLIEQESGWNAKIESPKGAQGLGQLHRKAPANVQLDPASNLNLAGGELRRLLDRYQNERVPNDPDWPVKLALAGYNGGQLVGDKLRRLGPTGITQMPRETQNFIERVLRNRSRYRQAGVGYAANAAPVSTVDPEKVRQEVERLQKLFNEGYVYAIQDIAIWVRSGSNAIPYASDDSISYIANPTTGRPLSQNIKAWDISKTPRNPDAFIEPGWLFPATTVRDQFKNTPTLKDVDLFIFGRIFDTGGPFSGVGSAHATQMDAQLQKIPFYYINPNALSLFVTERLRRGLPPIDPTRRVPIIIRPGDYANRQKDARLAQDFSAFAAAETNVAPPSPQAAFYNPHLKDDMFHDLRQEFIVGRLLGAFPTFYVAIVDGGRPLRIWRLYDHVYGMHAVTDITVHRTALGPVETAMVGFANMYGGLTSQAQELKRYKDYDPRGVWNATNIGRYISNWIQPDEETIKLWSKHLNSLMLKPGSRLHIRMGYGSDASKLPICFNGVITEVPITEGRVQVVALSDGLELLNDPEPNAAVGSMPVKRITEGFNQGINPRELILEFLDPSREKWGSLVAKGSTSLGQGVSPIFYYDQLYQNKYGIEHFGKPLRNWMSYHSGECGVNIYSPRFTQPVAKSDPWDNFLGMINGTVWQDTDRLIGIQIQGAKVWDIFDTCRKAVPDYVLYPVPTGLRSTLFYGKPWFPLYTDYKSSVDAMLGDDLSNDSPEKYFYRKTFQQIHIISSDYNLLENNVRADGTNVFTKCQAIGTYNGWLPGTRDMGTEQGGVQEVDSDIYTDHQKLKVIECPLYTTVDMKVMDALGSLNKFLAGKGTRFNYFANRIVVDYYAAMTLRDSVKQMYQGPFVILGNSWIKPYDLCLVGDYLSGMNGPCEVREVTHTLSLSLGYVTEVVPSCLVSYVDYEGQNLHLWAHSMATQFLGALTTARFIGNLDKNVGRRVTMQQLRGFIKAIDLELKNPSEGAKAFFGESADGLKSLREEIRTGMKKAGRSTTGLYQLLEDILKEKRFAKLMQYAPGTLQVGSVVNFQLWKLAGSTKQFITANLANASRDELFGIWSEADRNKLRDLGKEVDAARDELHRALDAKNLRQGKLGKEMRHALDRGGNITSLVRDEISASTKLSGKELNAAVKEVMKELDDPLKAFLKKSREFQALSGKGGLARAAVNQLRTITSATFTNFLTSSAYFVLVGSLSEWVYRWAHNRQCLVISPLKIWDNEFTAGILGHRGAVTGDEPGEVDQLLEYFAKVMNGEWGFALGFIPVLGEISESLKNSDRLYRHPPNPIDER